MIDPLPLRFRKNLDRLLDGGSADPPHLLVALSGGMDSTVLLHLLRFSSRAGALSAAHYDHRMRPESGNDAAWCRGLCVSWDVPLITGASGRALRTEAGARSSRYAFLQAAAREVGADWILTAHHADDQAETVLFRVLRGTGIHGLRGIPERNRERVMRPLLPFWREELREYAAASGIRWREDASNAGDAAARNRLRNTIIPMLEREIAPGARKSLVRLAQLAAESEEMWRPQLAEARARVIREHDGGYLVARNEIARYHPEIGLRLIRDVLRQLRSVPDRIGTRMTLQFITDAASGREKELPGGVRILIEHESARFYVSSDVPGGDREWVLERAPEPEGVSGRVTLGGRSYALRAEVATGPSADTNAWSFTAPLADLSFPLEVRARRMGDRIRLPGGTRLVKRLLIDRKVPGSARPTTPVLADSRGHVLWVGGVASALVRRPEAREPVLNLVLEQ